MFSKELQELDRNTVSYMIDEMQEEINQQKVHWDMGGAKFTGNYFMIQRSHGKLLYFSIHYLLQK